MRVSLITILLAVASTSVAQTLFVVVFHLHSIVDVFSSGNDMVDGLSARDSLDDPSEELFARELDDHSALEYTRRDTLVRAVSLSLGCLHTMTHLSEIGISPCSGP
jgi:hypothetical protein